LSVFELAQESDSLCRACVSHFCGEFSEECSAFGLRQFRKCYSGTHLENWMQARRGPNGKENDVASFCTKCGAAVTPDKQFCTACGAPTGAVAAYAPVQPPVIGAAPVAGAVPPAQGSNAVKVILIVLAIFVGLGILGASIFAFTVWRFSRALHVEGSGDKMTLHTPGATITANGGTTYSASDLGTDIYPGATTGHGSMKMDLPSGSAAMRL
jgi:zinc-ribbon domain